jgi:exosortase H (IPTLxxWG-CTERM-specific)
MSDRLRRWYAAHRVLIRFYVIFGYLMALLYLGLHQQTSHELLAQRFPALTAACVAEALDLLGQDAVAVGQTVSVRSGMSFQIIYHCSGLFLMSIFAAAVLAYPARTRERLLGLALGLPLLFAANVLRLAVLGVVGRYFPAYFDLSHEYLWQGLFVVLVLFLWVQWRDRIVEAPSALELSG